MSASEIPDDAAASTDGMLRAALRAETLRNGVRYAAAVSVVGDYEAPAHAAAHLLGYLHRFGDVPISVYDRETAMLHTFTAARLYGIARGREREGGDEPDLRLCELVDDEMLYWDEAPRYTGG